MGLNDALDRYFAAWNDHDPQRLVASLTDGGTYEDPTTGGPLSGEAVSAMLTGLITGFPDVRFEVVSVAATGETTAAVQWIMHGTNTGPMPGGPPTGATISLPGADFIDYDPVTDRLARVVGYFDTATMLSQLGLQAHISPQDMEPVTTFGVGLRVDAQRSGAPGALTVTWIEIDPEYQAALIEANTGIVMELMGNEDYLGSCFASIGRRNYTVSAWTSPDAARAALRGGQHAAGMRLANRGGIGEAARGITSVWVPETLNGIFHPGPGKSADLAGLEGQWL